MGGARAFEFEGLGLKVCELWNSPPPYQEYVCLILGTGREQSIFVMDLGRGGASSSGSGFSSGGSSSGGGSNLCCISDSVDPLDRCPQLRIPYSFGEVYGEVYCCAVKSTLYIFKIRKGRSGWDNQNGWDNQDGGIDVYSIYLQQLIKYSDAILDEKKMLKQHPILLSFKKKPVPLPFLDGILLFSTKILFYDAIDRKSFDFELYNPITKVCTRLPPLLIRPVTHNKTFQLFHHQTSHWEDFTIFKRSSVILPFFSIHSYALHNTEFLIQTDFGRMFSIDILRANAEWQLLDRGLNFSEYEDRGLKFMDRGRNFITSCGRMCIDADGVSRFRDKSVDSTVNDRVNRVDFPLPFIPGVYRSLALLDDQTPCFILVGPDAMHFETGEVLGNPNWCLDLFKADFANLLADADKNEDDEKTEHMERIASFKFCIKNQRVLKTIFLGLFPCRV